MMMVSIMMMDAPDVFVQATRLVATVAVARVNYLAGPKARLEVSHPPLLGTPEPHTGHLPVSFDTQEAEQRRHSNEKTRAHVPLRIKLDCV